MKKIFSLPSLGKSSCKTQNITKFYGYDTTNIKDGMLLDCENVTVLSSGALSSLPTHKKLDIDTSFYSSPEGVYTFYEDYDGDYEIPVDLDWISENICPERAFRYESWQKKASRIMVKEIGKPPKTEDGYREIVSAFFDGKNTFVFYTAEYNILDERRKVWRYEVGDGEVWQFESGTDDAGGFVRVCRLTQIYFDVIDENGKVTTMLVDGKIRKIEDIEDETYQYGTLISEDGRIFKYASYDYAPDLGEHYPIYFDNAYEDLFPILETFSPRTEIKVEPKRLVRYRNRINHVGDDYMDEGEKILVLPDMRLIKNKNGEWLLHEDANGNMPEMNAAVQQFDRLYGFWENTVYVSSKGDCTDYSFSEEENETPSSAWSMVTTDTGGFTAIAAFDGKVAVFTQSSMLVIKGNELPFSLSQEADCGCYSQEAVAVCDGVLYFVSKNGIMSYGKNTLKCISYTFENEIDYSKVRLANINGAIVAALNDSQNVRIYEPSSGQWSFLSVSGENILLTERDLIVSNGGVSSIYKAFDEFGEFSFKVALGNVGRRRIKSITVTANVGVDSELCLYDRKGRVLMNISPENGGMMSRTCYPRGVYFDHGELAFSGSGDVKLYGIFIEYESIFNVSANIG